MKKSEIIKQVINAYISLIQLNGDTVMDKDHEVLTYLYSEYSTYKNMESREEENANESN